MEQPSWSASLRLIGPVVALKVILLVAVYWSFALLAMPGAREGKTWRDGYSAWDGNYYLEISQHGYDSRMNPNWACFPLWPGMIHVGSFLGGGDALVASLVLTNLLSLGAIVVIHRVWVLRGGAEIADAGVVLLLAFPAAFLLVLPYSESLFLLLAGGLFLALRMERLRWVWVIAGLMALARPVGFFAVLPIVVDRWCKGRWVSGVILATGSLAGLLGYFAIMTHFTGDPLANVHVQEWVISHNRLANLLRPWDFAMKFVRGLGPEGQSMGGIRLHGVFNSGIDRAVFLVWAAGLAGIAWSGGKERWTDLAYGVPLTIVPAMSASMMSFTRFALVVIPVFYFYGRWMAGERRRWWLWGAAGGLFAIQILFLIRHVHYYWAV